MAELGYSTQNMPHKNKPHKPKDFTRNDWILRIIGFFISMAMPYGSMAPFGLSFLAQERKISFGAVVSFAAVTFGACVVCDRLGAAKYISAGVIYLSVLFVLEKDVRFNDFTAGLVAGGCVFLTGLVTLFWQGFYFSQFLLLLCETVAVVAGAMVLEKSSKLLKRGKFIPEELGSEEKLSLGALTAIAVLSLKEIYIGSEFSVMNTAASVALLVVAAGCGAGYSTGAGVILGLVCGIGSDNFLPILGAFSFCGFVAGVFARFGKSGVIAGVVLANATLIAYTNGAMESMLSLYEIMVAAIVFCFVKPKVIGIVGEIICLDQKDRASILKLKEQLRSRLQAVADSFEAMARTLERLSEKNREDNTADLATFFDLAADRVCKKCKKSSVCWNKDFDFTYKSLFELMQAMDEKGIVDPSDASEEFRARCVELTHLVAELNHQLDIHQVRCVWRSRLKESRMLVGEQLSGVSGIISGISAEIASDISFERISEADVREKFEEKGIPVRELEVIQEKNGRYRIEIGLRRSYWTEELQKEVEKMMKGVFRNDISMKTEPSENGRFVKVEIFDAEKFCVETSFAQRAASEESGDNYRFSHISGGKYVIALSDGMGTGIQAARESEAMLELLDSFLRAGFDSRMAVKFINSIMLLKSNEEAFVTIDVCIIDLYTGETEFIKTGAEPSFIMKKHGVDTVKAASLPVGVIADMEAEIASKTMVDGDVIVMITDGVESRESGSMWIGEFIEKAAVDSPETGLAHKILSHAIERNKGEVNDDMTVLSVRLKKVS